MVNVEIFEKTYTQNFFINLPNHLEITFSQNNLFISKVSKFQPCRVLNLWY